MLGVYPIEIAGSYAKAAISGYFIGLPGIIQEESNNKSAAPIVFQ